MQSDEQTREDVRRFECFLRNRNLRLTRQREIIASRVFSQTEHFDAESLLAAVRGQDRSVSRATVYRTLALLVESRMVEEKDFGKGYRLYEQVTSQPHHEHLVCTKTGTVIEFKDEAIERMLERIARRYHFRMTGHSITIYGISKEAQDQEE